MKITMITEKDKINKNYYHVFLTRELSTKSVSR